MTGIAAMARTLITVAAAAAITGCGAKTAPTTGAAPPMVAADGDHHDHDDAVEGAATGEDHGHHLHADDDHVPPPAASPPPPPLPDAAQVKADLVAAESAAYLAARPVFTTYCAACHQQGGKKATAKKLGHFDMTGYPFGGHHAAEIASAIREVLGVGGGKPTMPKDKPGAVRGDEFALIVAWAAAWDAAEAASAHPDRPPHGH